MELSYNRGIVLRYQNEKILLDPENSRNEGYPTIVTHAHSDHSAALSGKSTSYVTPATLDLFNANNIDRSITKRPKNIKKIEFNEPFDIGNFEIELIFASHLLGAAQIVVRQGTETFLFTSDFCPEPLLTIDGAAIPKDVDVCVMDSTYGDDKIIFQNRNETRERLFVWAISELSQKKIPIFNIAHMGGAQELIKLFNKLAPNLPILVDSKIKQICDVYYKYGIALNYLDINSPDGVKALDDRVIVLIPRAKKSIDQLHELIKDKNISRGIVTGQSAKFGFNSFDFSSALSTHASYTELIQFALKLDPLKVFTHYGFTENLANKLKKELNISSNELKKCYGFDISQISRENKITKLNKINQINPYSTEELWEDWF